MTNEINNEIPRPIGWLYYHPETYKLYYANSKPDNMKYLCDWNMGITWDGTRTPKEYRPFITKNGDIVFVWRGELSSTYEESRQNPIVYPAGDYNNPVVVDLGTGIKPTSWLMNTGADYIYNQGVFLFAEYTRPVHENAYVWRVTEPLTDPNNWTTVHSIPISADVSAGYKHYHTINYDPFSHRIYMTTGDVDIAAKIFSSNDYGLTWNIELEGDRSYARVTNFIFTKDKAYYANDDNLHYLYSIPRDVNGVLDFTQVERLYNLSGHPPTYINVLIEDPYGILILNRHDSPSNGPLSVLFRDIETGTMHNLKDLYPYGDSAITYGFRVEAANFYHAKGDNRIVTGFGNPFNRIGILGNSYASLVNNIAMEVRKIGDVYDIKFSAIAY